MRYWVSTSVISIFLLCSSYTYFFSEQVVLGVRELGFPDFFRIQLGVLKLIAAICLFVPVVPWPIKEWSYAGVAFFLLTALVAHIAHDDSPAISALLCGLFLTLAVSRLSGSV